MVRTAGSHPVNRGSIPRGVTKNTGLGSRYFCSSEGLVGSSLWRLPRTVFFPNYKLPKPTQLSSLSCCGSEYLVLCILGMFDFEKLDVYRKAKELNKEVQHFLRLNKKIDSYIRDQLRRASISMVINIAEGSGKFSPRDKSNFYTISRGSVYESVCSWLFRDRSIELNGLL